MGNSVEIQDEFEVEMLSLVDFESTALVTQDSALSVQSTGVTTCPSKTGQYC